MTTGIGPEGLTLLFHIPKATALASLESARRTIDNLIEMEDKAVYGYDQTHPKILPTMPKLPKS